MSASMYQKTSGTSPKNIVRTAVRSRACSPSSSNAVERKCSFGRDYASATSEHFKQPLTVCIESAFGFVAHILSMGRLRVGTYSDVLCIFMSRTFQRTCHSFLQFSRALRSTERGSNTFSVLKFVCFDTFSSCRLFLSQNFFLSMDLLDTLLLNMRASTSITAAELDSDLNAVISNLISPPTPDRCSLLLTRRSHRPPIGPVHFTTAVSASQSCDRFIFHRAPQAPPLELDHFSGRWQPGVDRGAQDRAKWMRQ